MEQVRRTRTARPGDPGKGAGMWGFEISFEDALMGRAFVV